MVRPGIGSRSPSRGRARGLATVLLVVAAAALVGVWLSRRWRPAPDAISASPVAFLSSAPDDAAFARVTEPLALDLARDQGPHPDFRTEWWYYTGNLADADGGRFGFQLTFFRNAIAPDTAPLPPGSEWRTRQAYLAHFALTDVDAGRFHSAERLARGALGLAGALRAPFRVWVDSWSAQDQAGRPGAVRLSAADGPVGIDVALRSLKPVVLHGDRGFSPKGPEAGNASMYYSFTRLEASGDVTSEGARRSVTGLAWMDHEWSTSALDAETQTGWDWFSLQLDDGTELMLFQIRETDGGTAPESSGTFVDHAGATAHLRRSDFRIEPRGAWRSPRTGAEYPSGWRVEVPSEGLSLSVEPLLDDQELSTFIRYWEGAVRLEGTVRSRPVSGFGYVELTGYAGAGTPGGL